jgi:hypothetical protein
MKRQKPEERFYTPQEVGNMTGFSASFIRGEIKAGQLKAVLVRPANRTTGRWKIPRAAAFDYAMRLGAWTDEATRTS